MIDSFTKKAFVFFGSLLLLLIFIGNNIEDEPIKIEPWVKRTNHNYKMTQKGKPSYNFTNQRPWSDDRKEQTENWADFLETLENRGYTIYDPEAEDIWEEFY